MEIDYDDAKNRANIAKHGLPLSVGAFVLQDPNRLTGVDDRRDYGEDRFIALGKVWGRVLVAVYIVRDDVYRFISVRKANAREQERYTAGSN